MRAASRWERLAMTRQVAEAEDRAGRYPPPRLSR
jgi:hypothetical protein